MAIKPYRPVDVFRPFFDEFMSSPWGGRLAGSDLLRTPDADVEETADAVRVFVELPGLRPEDVELTLENNVLTVSGEKKEEREEEGADHRWHLSERRYGRFSRSFVLPREVDREHIQANFENGVLRVTVPKTERAKPRRIRIEGGEEAQKVEAGTRSK